MAKLTPTNLLRAFESSMNRATLDGDRVHTNVGRREKATARYGIQDILYFLNDGAVQVGLDVRSRFVPGLVDTQARVNGPFLDSGVSGTINSIPNDNILRLRGDQVFVDAVRAKRRTFRSNEEYAISTAARPSYTFEGGQFVVRGDTVDPTGGSAKFVYAPVRVVTQTTLTSYTSATGSLVASSSIFSEAKHKDTICFLTDGSDVYTGRITAVSSGTHATVDSQAPDLSSPDTIDLYTWGFTLLDERFEKAVVEMAVALAFASQGDGERMSSAITNYNNEIEQYLLPGFDIVEYARQQAAANTN